MSTMFVIVPLLLVGLLLATLIWLVTTRRAAFRALVEYAELDRQRQSECKNIDEARLIIAECLARKGYLLCHRWITLTNRFQEARAITQEDAHAVIIELEHYQQKLQTNPYRHEELEIPLIPIQAVEFISEELFDQWRELLEELGDHHAAVFIYNKLFGIPKSVI